MSLEVEAKVEVTDKSKRCCQEEEQGNVLLGQDPGTYSLGSILLK